MKQIDRSLGGPEFPVDNHNSSVASESSGQECRAGITVRPTQNPLSFLRDRGSLSHKLLHQEETTKNCCSTNAHLGIVCQGITFTFDGSIASLPLPPSCRKHIATMISRWVLQPTWWFWGMMASPLCLGRRRTSVASPPPQNTPPPSLAATADAGKDPGWCLQYWKRVLKGKGD